MRRLAPLLTALAACALPADEPPVLDAPLVIAVRASPAEVAPGAPVSLEALTIAPFDEPAPASIRWDLCLLPPPLVPDLPVDPRCADEHGPHLVPLAAGRFVSLTVPHDACARFGPSPAPAEPGQPAPRPVDPDASAGFSLPLRVQPEGGPVTLARVRLSCPAANLPADAARRLQAAATPNRHPRLVRFGAVSRDGALVLRAEAATDAAERFLDWDPAAREVAEREEVLLLSLHVTSGTLDARQLPISAGETVEVRLEEAEARYEAWAVLRDERGGVDLRSIRTR